MTAEFGYRFLPARCDAPDQSHDGGRRLPVLLNSVVAGDGDRDVASVLARYYADAALYQAREPVPALSVWEIRSSRGPW